LVVKRSSANEEVIKTEQLKTDIVGHSYGQGRCDAAES